MRSSDDLDQALDRALSSYSNVEPRAGIEARVLRRARTARSRWRWLMLVPVLLAALVLVIALPFRSVPPPPGPPALTAEVPRTLIPSEVHRASFRTYRIRVVGLPASLPRKSVFPTPTQLTPEEQAMVLLTVRHPKEAQVLAERGGIEPILIPELRIEPLQVKGE